MKINDIKEKTSKAKSKFSFSGLFNNNRFVLVFSVLASIVLWFTVAMSSTDTDSRQQIEDISIDATLSQTAQDDGLMIFEMQPDTKAGVSVTGNRRIISQLTNKDIQVTAQQAKSIITAPGTYTLALAAKQTGILTDYEISQSSLWPQQVTVMVDRNKVKEFAIQDDNMKYQTDPNCYSMTPKFNPEKVTVSGPETEISKINKISAVCQIDEPLTSTKTVTVSLKLYDSAGNELTTKELEHVTMSVKDAEATITVLKRKVVPVVVSLTNAPSGWLSTNSRITIAPNTLEVAAPDSTISSFKQLILGTLDFSKLSLTNNRVEMTVELPTGCKNLSNTSTAVVSLNVSDMSSKTITVDKFSFTNYPTGKRATAVTKSLSIEVVGLSSQIETLTADNITVKIDLKNKESFTGNTDVPVTFAIDGAPDCWVHGSYTATVGLESTASSTASN